LYVAKLSFIIEGEINLSMINTNKKFMTTKPALQKILKGILCTEEEEKHNHDYWEK
jgi:hypothetical protein